MFCFVSLFLLMIRYLTLSWCSFCAKKKKAKLTYTMNSSMRLTAPEGESMTILYGSISSGMQVWPWSIVRWELSSIWSTGMSESQRKLSRNLHWNLKLQSPPPMVPPLTKSHLLIFSKQLQQLDTKHSNKRFYEIHSHSNQHTKLCLLLKIG